VPGTGWQRAYGPPGADSGAPVGRSTLGTRGPGHPGRANRGTRGSKHPPPPFPAEGGRPPRRHQAAGNPSIRRAPRAPPRWGQTTHGPRETHAGYP